MWCEKCGNEMTKITKFPARSGTRINPKTEEEENIRIPVEDISVY